MNKVSLGFMLLVSIVCTLLSVSALASAPSLKGELTQGSLIRANISPGAQVWLNGNQIAVSPTGEFVFGFGRDAALEHTLEWQLNDTKQSMPITLKAREYDIQRIEGVAQKYVSPPEAVLARIRQDNREIANARATQSQLKDFLDTFIMPAQGRISGVYGSQRYFNGEPRRPHFGLDVANQVGTPVVAPVGGVISLAHDDMYYSGGTLIMDHGFGVSSTFIHLSKIHVETGQRVEQGDVIGEIGATGRVTGPHLDWRINWYKERLDPALLLESEALDN
ncbi:M23 family metallopeptidase [Glaciecola sp. XM2]|jgi:murein DD-endopeptidase MepM/ murein hydrolase activator NlpD|uniref:M23 family metallopeptidase n=1 Tax=Glaciecola sp. XM2 TaxID=1914931 RepID=UPI00203221C4|nr:M23 family metallopeptidase [Glaciecola sp. XM2]